MKYVIVSIVRRKAGEFNENLRQHVKTEYGIKSSTLPAHFTIKAPFEFDGSLEELKMSLHQFADVNQAEPYLVKGYDHFERRVIYMDVIMSNEGKKVHDELIDLLEAFSYIQCDELDGKDKKFHITIASRKIEPIYDEIWEFVQHQPCEFECIFDNISLYHLGENGWELEESFELR